MKLKFKTQLDKSGRVTIPPEIISELHLTPGVIFGIEEKNGKITLEQTSDEPELIEKNGLLVVRPKITGNIETIVQQDRDGR